MSTVSERFLRYVSFDTQSDPESPTCPSTEKQKVLGAELVAEMKAMGIADAFMDEHGYVYGTVPGDEIKISTDDSKVQVWIIPTNEELMIAQDTAELVKG